MKVAAFQTILAKLLDHQLRPPAATQHRQARARTKLGGRATTGPTMRIVGLIDEGIFSEQRSLAQIRALLSERGWYYSLEDLGTPLRRLVTRKLLRRTRASEGAKKVWLYSAY